MVVGLAEQAAATPALSRRCDQAWLVIYLALVCSFGFPLLAIQASCLVPELTLSILSHSIQAFCWLQQYTLLWWSQVMKYSTS